MTETDQPAVAVVFDPASRHRMAPKPKVHWWTWVGFFVYNLARKPKVWKWQREQEEIYQRVKERLKREVLPHLWQVRIVCPQCRNAYGTLRDQTFLSMIKMILKNMRCDNHPEPYDQFLIRNNREFERADDLAAWINGFKRA
jgi:hypothetical protein